MVEVNEETRRQYRHWWYEVHSVMTAIEQIVTEDFPDPDGAEAQPTRYQVDCLRGLHSELSALIVRYEE
jgi:hypothetical protein